MKRILLVALAALACDAHGAEFTVNYAESPSEDVVSCQFEVRRSDDGTPLVTSMPFAPLEDGGDVRSVTFTGDLAAAPGDQFDLSGFCTDADGLTSQSSNLASVVIPDPPEPPVIESCQFKITYANGTTQTLACVVPPPQP